MAKFKPHKGVRKRVKVTGTGKIVRPTAGKSKLLSHKSGRRKQHLRRTKTAEGRNAERTLLVLGRKYLA